MTKLGMTRWGVERFYRVVLVADKVAGRLRQREQGKDEIKPAGDGCAAAVAQQAKQKLIFRCHCKSCLALQMAPAVSDQIARSPRYTLVVTLRKTRQPASSSTRSLS